MLKTNVHASNEISSAVVIGASLSGLMAGIALAREGIQVTILDKVSEQPRAGAGLRVDGASFGQSETERHLRKIVSSGRSSIQLWSTIESRLRKEALADSSITLKYSTRVVSVGQNEDIAWAMTEDGEQFSGDILIGADGHRSIVRRHVAPEKPDAQFANYMVWMASTDEFTLPEERRPAKDHQEVTFLRSTGGMIIGSIIEKDNEGTGSEGRRIGCTWYDSSRNEMLREIGCVRENVVHHTLQGADIPEATVNEMTRQVAKSWSEPWASAMLHALKERSLMGIPIKEYVPDRLVSGRVALVGDAAHVPAPVTASGFNASVTDAAALGKCAAKGLCGEAGVKALKKYESIRLTKVRSMVESGQFFGRSFGI